MPTLIAVLVALVFAVLGAVLATSFFWGSIVAFVGGLVWIVAVSTRAGKAVADA